MRNLSLMMIGLCASSLITCLCNAPMVVAASAKGKRSGKASVRAHRPKHGPAAAPIIIDDGADDDVVAEPEADAPAAVPAEVQQPAPAAAPAPQVPAPSQANENALAPEALRARYDQLRDQVFRSRARRETLEHALVSTKVRFELRWEANRKYRLEKAEIRLDGTRIWDTTERPVTEEPVALAERSAAPGAHGLTVRLEVRSRDKVEMGYASEQTFYVSLPEGKLSHVRISVDEDGSLPSYNPDVQIKVDTE